MKYNNVHFFIGIVKLRVHKFLLILFLEVNYMYLILVTSANKNPIHKEIHVRKSILFCRDG